MRWGAGADPCRLINHTNITTDVGLMWQFPIANALKASALHCGLFGSPVCNVVVVM